MPRPGPVILLLTIVVLPAATVVFLGARLLQQDRELERQRRAELLQDASDRTVAALQRDLSSLMLQTADAAWPAGKAAPGTVHLVATRDVRIDPVDAVEYWPTTAPLEPVPADPFRRADAMELGRQDLPGALEVSRRLASSPGDASRAGALMRQARILRKLGRRDEALGVYSALARITSVSINGLPADLQARKTRCVLLAEQSRSDDLRREAQSLEHELASGRWRLDRQDHEYLDALLDQWLGSARQPRQEHRQAMSAAAEWVYRRWTTIEGGARTASGSHILPGTTPITIVWTSSADRLAAAIVTAAWIDQEWLTKAQRAAAPAIVSLAVDGDSRITRSSSTAETSTLVRTAADTGLPWTVVVSLSHRAGTTQFESRRRTLLTALGAVLVLVATGTYFILRARSREMTLARLQSDFVTAVSHEFRTPLTALLQFNDLLDDSADLPIDKRRSYYQAQRRATDRLHRLVESLLDFGRMEAGKRLYALERLDAALLVRDVIDEFRDELEGRGMSLSFSADSGQHDVDADPEALALAIWNLLDNAAKYSGDVGEIDVTVTHTGDAVVIAVRDHGIGIPPAEQGRIFQKFTRGTVATSKGIRGTGVGLAMVQHIVTGHRGTLKVESLEGHGSTFTIVLRQAPLAHAVDEAGAAAPQAPEVP